MLGPFHWWDENREYYDDLYHKLIRNHYGTFLIHKEVSELRYLTYMLDTFGPNIGLLGVQFLSDEAYDAVCNHYPDTQILPE